MKRGWAPGWARWWSAWWVSSPERTVFSVEALDRALEPVRDPLASSSGPGLRVNDSKCIYRGGKGLEHLEKTALAFFRAACDKPPRTLGDWLEGLAGDSVPDLGECPWYGVSPKKQPLPRRLDGTKPIDTGEPADTAGPVVATHRLRQTLNRAGIRSLRPAQAILTAPELNRRILRYGNKARAEVSAVLHLVKGLLNEAPRGVRHHDPVGQARRTRLLRRAHRRPPPLQTGGDARRRSGALLLPGASRGWGADPRLPSRRGWALPPHRPGVHLLEVHPGAVHGAVQCVLPRKNAFLAPHRGLSGGCDPVSRGGTSHPAGRGDRPLRPGQDPLMPPSRIGELSSPIEPSVRFGLLKNRYRWIGWRLWRCVDKVLRVGGAVIFDGIKEPKRRRNRNFD